MITKMVDFFRTGVWRVRVSELSRVRAFFIQALRILLLAIQGISRGRTYLRASSLTFYSLLSVVPILATLFGVAQGFGLGRILEKHLMEMIEGQEEAFSRIIEFSHNLLETTRGGILAGVSVLVLFWAVIRVFGNIEDAFNEVWGVKTGRSLIRKITDYPPLLFLYPLLFIISSTLAVVARSEVSFFAERIRLLELLGPVILFIFELVPLLMLWVLFTFIYKVMPTTRVNFGSAILGGVIAGTLYVVFQQIYITFQVGVSNYNAIYGSFAALPLFLAWLQTSWMIVMVGAEISCAHQNVHLHEYDMDVSQASPYLRKVLALSVMRCLLKRFVQGERPPGERQVAESLEVPVVFVQNALNELVTAGVVSEVKTGRSGEQLYQPSVDASVVTVGYVLRALDHSGCEDLLVAREGEMKQIGILLRDMEAHLQSLPANIHLKDI